MSQGKFKAHACYCSQALVRDVSIIMHLIVMPVPRSPSVTTMRDIDPKLPAARHNLDGYSMSDGDWPADDRYVLI